MHDGGSPVTSYIVSWKWPYLKYSSERTVGRTEDTQFLVTNLEEGREYLFYIRAQNKKGNSEALDIITRTSVANGEFKNRLFTDLPEKRHGGLRRHLCFTPTTHGI